MTKREGITCYEADEDMCTLKTCIADGCILRSARLGNERAEAERKALATELADWLLHMQKMHQSIVHLPGGAEHAANLVKWENMVRELAK